MTADPELTTVPCGPVIRVCTDTAWGVGTATFTADERHRLRLSRVWDRSLPRVAFTMLNPSIADASVLDPTVRRCMGFAQAWGFGSCEITNVFAIRSTDPRGIRTDPDPVGPGNDDAILAAARAASFVVAAWGVHAAYLDRGAHVAALLQGAGVDVRALSVTRAGHPGHPLYLPSSSLPVSWSAPHLHDPDNTR